MTAASSHARHRLNATRWSILVVPLVAFVAHVPALTGGFVLDDGDLLVENPFVRTLGGLKVLLTSELFMACASPRRLPYWRPLSGALNWASWQVLAGSAPGQHLINIILLAIVATLAACAMITHSVPRLAASTGGALLAAHPAGSEIAAYVEGRQWLLGAAIMLAGIAVMPRTKGPWAIGVVCFTTTLLAYCSQEFFMCSALLLPMQVTMLRVPDRRAASVAVALCASVAACAANQWMRSVLGIMPQSLQLQFIPYLGSVAGTLVRILKDVLWPSDLALNVTIEPLRIGSAIGLLLGAFLLAIGLVRFVHKRRNVETSTLCALALTLIACSASLPALVVVKSGYLSDRYASPALIAFALLVGVALGGARRYIAASAVGLAFVFALLPTTWARDASWASESALYQSSLEVRPNDPQSLIGMSYERIAANDIDGAYPYCVRYQQIAPNSDRADFCLGAHAFEHGDLVEAIPYFRHYAGTHGYLESARRALLAALIAAGRLDDAEAQVGIWQTDYAGAPDLDEATAAIARRRRDPAADPQSR